MVKDNLRKFRQERGLSQKQLADELHVVRQTVSKWERGTSVPDADLLMALAQVLGVSAAALLGEEVAPVEDAAEAALQSSLDSQNVGYLTRFRSRARVGLATLATLSAVLLLAVVLLGRNLAEFYDDSQTGFVLQGTYENSQMTDEGIWMAGARLSFAERPDGGFDGFWQLSGFWNGEPVAMREVGPGAYQAEQQRDDPVVNGGFVKTSDPNIVILQDENHNEVGWAHVAFTAGRRGQEGLVFAEYQGVSIRAPKVLIEVAHYPREVTADSITTYWAPAGVEDGVSAETWFGDNEERLTR